MANTANMTNMTNTMNIFKNLYRGAATLLAACAFAGNVYADDPVINIGGDVYGGGKEGKVGTNNITSGVSADADAASVTLVTDGAETVATEVVINSGNVRTVFGGGKNGRAFGKTTVAVNGGTIGGEEWDGTIHGGVFGAGDGESALVFGHDEVTLKGGTIYNNVYGGGNQADLIGSTTVTLQGGKVYGNLFGGARMANIKGRTYVNIDGVHAINDLIVKAVYGGNDISGQIQHSTTWSWLNDGHYGVLPTNALARDAAGNNVITNEWNAFVYSTPSATKTIFVGNLYGGGNGDYSYSSDGEVTLPCHKVKSGNVWGQDDDYEGDPILDEDGNPVLDSDDNPTYYTSMTFGSAASPMSPPVLGKTYLQLQGGVFGYVYGGGNNATVTANTEIYINNTTSMETAVTIPAADAAKMGLQFGGQCPTYTVSGTAPDDVAEFKYQFDRVFGGNNKAAMDIQPRWYLVQAKINNLYSGGNAGNMTNENGILINIFQNTDTPKDRVEVVNVYGGCRMADVIPTDADGEEVNTAAKTYFTGSDYAYTFPAKYSARVYISGGKISNVYGGNDISGSVHGGTDVEIHGAIAGDVYGGGNGSYAYTDNASLKNDPEWGDFYYAADGTLTGTAATDAASSLDGMYKKRPHVDNSLVHISGKEENRVYVTGNVYCGGNSASLEEGKNATAKFQIGPYVTMNGVYLGSNGANMITQEMLRYYNNKIVENLSLTDLDNTAKDNGLTNFDKYLKGVEVDVRPTIEWDDDLNYTTQIGAFVCGGNVGSMAAPGTFTLNLPEDLVIFDRLVGGCNAANVNPVMDTDGTTALNPFHLGGVTAAASAGQPKLILNADARLEPHWLDYSIDPNTHFLTSTRPLAYNWNTEVVTTEAGANKRIFKGANIYGGCYTSGYVNGGVEINISKNIISPAITNIDDEIANYQIDANNETETSRTAAVEGLRTQRDYIFASTLAAYGGGYGADTEIWGDVTVNVSDKAGILKVYGGGEQGIIGHIARNADGKYLDEDEEVFVAGAGKKYNVVEPPCNTVVNLVANMTKPAVVSDTSTGNDLFNVGRVYGGGFQGVVTGNTALYLGGGKVSEAIAGAANADIYGYTEMFIGDDLAGDGAANKENPFVAAREFGIRGNVYGGNDFGGKIWGTAQHSAAAEGNMPAKKVRSNTYVEYQRGLIGNSVYGGACGNYDYTNAAYTNALAVAGFIKPTLLGVVAKSTGDTHAANTFVNVLSKELSMEQAFVGYPVTDPNSSEKYHGAFFGGGKGYLDQTGIVDMNNTYVLLHASSSRNDFLTPNIFGGGYYSIVKNSLVDAYTGNFNIIYGGTYGATADQNETSHLKDANYQNDATIVNIYPSFTTNDNVTIYGSGGYAGTKVTNVNLYGGKVGNVYGGSVNEGVCYETNVNVFADYEVEDDDYDYAVAFNGSTVSAKALFGGSKGAADALPCDVLQSNVKFHSDKAYVRGDGTGDAYIYGGNHSARATEKTNVDVTVPVRTADGGDYVNICGAGYGSQTVAGFTTVNLANGAIVKNVYGGGRDGKVLDQYDILTTTSPEDDASTYPTYSAKTKNETYSTYTDAPTQTYAYWTTPSTDTNTDIEIAANARVEGSVYGAGLGDAATVTGSTLINTAGTIVNDIYGGGMAGDVRKMASTDLGYKSSESHALASTTINMTGGTARIVYGGGKQGNVGASSEGYTATTNVNIGTKDGTTYAAGVPAIQRSLYGGGEMGAVFGTANTTLNNGYIGYTYNGTEYQPLIKLDEKDEKNLLTENGNLFGAGYGEGAVVEKTNVIMHNGHVRNSVYGGGEISAVGWGSVNPTTKAYIETTHAGATKVEMYGGEVDNDVFGGGRGYSYNLTGNMEYGTKFFTDGYVFGTTDVNIHRGTIGTAESMKEENGGHGNVFGGGNVGFVYGVGTKANDENGYYYKDGKLTEDCRVSVEVYGKATAAVTVNGTDYAAGDYIPNEDLNTLSNSSTEWASIDQEGITIRNAVFAGGNVTRGSDKVFAFANTVFGNATAAIVDVYCRDLITVGGDGIGGIYGDGNLTFVDGYRELNITNYGTDYFALPGEVDFSKTTSDAYIAYLGLTDRQKAFYTSKYIYKGGNSSLTGYVAGDMVLEEEYNKFTDAQKVGWEKQGAIINEGRYINTVQRCDFCGIKGSRLVLRGAMDRAQEDGEADFTNYTINRVDELSLNQFAGAGANTGTSHGCYFGIYNVVKYLGSLTSDLKFTDVRKTDSDDEAGSGNKAAAGGKDYGTATYWDWKEANLTASNRNNGSSPNKVALASGVYLELVKRLKPDGSKDYGPITGIVELDLLNVTPGEGGGYVYAQNIHGTPTYDEDKAIASVLSDANTGLVTNNAYTYSAQTENNTQGHMQTSGNFVHSLKRVIDDCFPLNGNLSSPAHYWYLRGDFYVYEQLVSAYTGGADAYSKDISIPLTIDAQSNATLRLINVLPGLYADPTQVVYRNEEKSDTIGLVYAADVKKFGQNDPISYWDWYMAPDAEKDKFVLTTYVCRETVKVGSKVYYPGEAILPATYNGFADENAVDENGESVKDYTGKILKIKECFNITNSISNSNGFLLTLDLSNPNVWNDYYTNINDGTRITTKEWNEKSDADKKLYVKSATFRCNESGTYGQYEFTNDAIISKTVHDMQTEAVKSGTTATQATFVQAYVSKDSCDVTIDSEYKTILQGTPISATSYGTMVGTDQAHFEPAYICVNTVAVSDKKYRVLNEVIGQTEYNKYGTNAAIQNCFEPAYYCTNGGSWGGKYYVKGKDYQGVDYCQLLPGERQYFTYNYDALDLLRTNYDPYNTSKITDVNGDGKITEADVIAAMKSTGTKRNEQVSGYDKNPSTNPLYSQIIPIDYKAYASTGIESFTYVDDGRNEKAIGTTDSLTNVEFENLPNDRKNYAKFNVGPSDVVYTVSAGFTSAGGKTYTVGQQVRYSEFNTLSTEEKEKLTANTNIEKYIVKETFDVAGVMYNAGQTLSYEQYESLRSSFSTYLEKIELTSPGDYYYCINEYKIGANDKYVKDFTSSSITPVGTTTVLTVGSTVNVGTIIPDATYKDLPNYQKGFTIKGQIPVEEATLYVPVTADINDLMEDRYVTAIYEYKYTEADAQGLNYETRVEKHIINIRLKFLSGAPTIGPLEEPDLILPLERIGMKVPLVEEGAFPVLSGGWEIYAKEADAKKHRNGREYANNAELMYWYQNDYWIAYYAETRMGKTYSDPVQIRVANYQRLSDVINNANHMFIDHKDCQRDPKIYIDDRTFDAEGQTNAVTAATGINELDALQKLFALTNTAYGTNGGKITKGGTGEDKDNVIIQNHGRTITGCEGLDIFIQSDVAPTGTSWASIGNDTHCFGGDFHGNGHTISGLDNSLFGKLCGNVYNLGVMGTFTDGGVANTGDGYIENCWTWTTGTPDNTKKAVYNDPDNDEHVHVVNCYYYPNASGTYAEGPAVPRSAEDFLNGQVAYDLNRFYLEARYLKGSGSTTGTVENTHYVRLADGSIEQRQMRDASNQPVVDEDNNPVMENVPHTVKYDTDYAWYTKYNDNTKKLGYVENYYADGDFRYADGLKPKTADIRVAEGGFVPVYPDDYIFFGQKLSYDLYSTVAHDQHPMAAVKDKTVTATDGTVDNSQNALLTSNETTENRIYRAPAYFRNGTYGKSVVFNATAAFAMEYKVGTDTYYPHKNMTAVDFTGYKDKTWQRGNWTKFNAPTADDIYKPLLDFDRLDAIKTSGLTQNLLAYAPGTSSTADTKTREVISDYFNDPVYAETNETYRTVAVASAGNGHVVVQDVNTTGAPINSYTALVDHLLVDKQDFNAPIAYTFADDKRMWYQRKPNNYAQGNTGWEGVSLPFAAELVTTQTKGEITHFYTGSKVGHEYWLRGYNGKVLQAKAAETDPDVYVANFTAPAAGSNDKVFKNTYLYDYYYSKDEFQDKNTDEYQKQYYKADGDGVVAEYDGYPYSVAGTPYIAGFPGEMYYEFDLSGKWTPLHRINDVTISSPGAQTITFASEAGATIAVSDTECTAVSKDDYDFMPTYLNNVETTDNVDYYSLNSTGSAFDKVAQTTVDSKKVTAPFSVAFRPYFTPTPSSGAKQTTRSIVIGESKESMFDVEERQNANAGDGGLTVRTKRGGIVITSSLKGNRQVLVSSVNGTVIATFSIEPGETRIVPINAPGIYLVNNKKFTVNN